MKTENIKYKDSASRAQKCACTNSAEALPILERKFKDSGISWIGEIPNDWSVKKLNWLFSIIGSGTTPKATNDSFYEGKINWIQSGDINGGDIVECKNKISEQVLQQYSALKVYEKPFIIVAMYGASVGNISISRINGCVNQACCVMGNSNQSFAFLFYAIKSAKDYLIYRAEGGGQPNISQDKLKNLKLPIPPLPTQQRIADFLDRKCAEIDELSALQETMIAELKRYKQSVITEAVTKGLDKNVKMKDSGVEWIGEIPEGWEVIPFKQMYNLGKGLSITKADLVEKGVPVISYGQIHSKNNTGTTIKDELIRYVPTSFLENSKDALVKIGDIIFADTSEDLEGCGNCIYVDRDMTLFAGYHTIIASYRGDFSSRYLPYLFKTDCWRLQIRSVVNGVKLFSVPQKTLAATSIILPPFTEQQAIADYLDKKCAEIDELIAIKQQKIEALKEYKKSVIFEYVTGKREI